MKKRALIILMAFALCVGVTACTNGGGQESEESQVSEEQTKTGTEESSEDPQGGGTAQGTEQTEAGPEVAMLNDFEFATYYTLDRNGNKVAEYHWDEISKNLRDAGQLDMSYASIYAAGDGVLFSYRYGVKDDIWYYYAYAIEPKENKVVTLMTADDDWWLDGMDYYDGKIYVTATSDGYQKKEYVFAKDPGSFSFTQEKSKYDSVIQGMEGYYATLYSSQVGRSYGACCYARALDEAGYVIGEKDNVYYLFKKDGSKQEISAFKNYVNIAGYDEHGIVFYSEDESGLYGLSCLYLETGETKPVFLGSDENQFLTYANGKVYYSVKSPGFVHTTNAVWSYDVATGKSKKLYEKSSLPGAAEITPGTYLLRVIGNDIYYVDVNGDKTEWIRVKQDGDGVRFENTGLLVGEKNAFRYGTVSYDEFVIKCPGCGIPVLEYYGEAFQLDGSYSSKADRINKTLMDDLTDVIERYKSSYSNPEHGEEICAEHLEWPIIYCETVEDEVNNVRIISNKYLAVDCSGYWYGGGAHGMPYSSQYLFDLTTGDRMYLKDFYTGTEKEFKNLVASKTREDFLSYGDEEYGTPYFATDARALYNEAYEYASIDTSHVEFSEEGIYVIYDPYEMGPYASGFIEIFISYEELLGRPNL